MHQRLAGDDLGFSLALVGATTSASDLRYTKSKMLNFDDEGSFGPVRRAPDADHGLHAQPTVVRVHFWKMDDSREIRSRYVAYSTNADVSAPGPRRLRVWYQDGSKRDADIQT